jgi:SAM-dependent methyltransferase
METTGTRLTEPWSEDLIWQAVRGAELGEKFCTCEGYYHCLWGPLRASGAMRGLSSEEQILSDVMTPFIRQNARVLIGGSADAGVLCSLGRIYGPVKAAFTVVDRCRSPLELIREFTAAKRVSCRTLNVDILELDDREKWDQIVLHYTANFVDADHREKFLGRIARVLEPGGTLVCAVKTGEEVFAEQRDTLEAAFLARSRGDLQQFLSHRRIEIPDLETMLRAYASAATTRRLNMSTLPEMQETLRNVGLRVLSVHSTPRTFRYYQEQGSGARVDSSTLMVATRDL